MNAATVSVNVIAAVLFTAAFLKDSTRAKQVLRVAVRSLIGILPTVFTIITLIGLLLGFVTPQIIRGLLGDESGLFGILTAALIGSVMHIPSLIAFPLASSLLEGGAAVGTVAGFIAGLTMIGVVTFPIEVRELGIKMTVLRNGLGFLFAVTIALLMGVIL